MNMRTLTKDMRIFSYRTEPLHGLEGDDGGFSIEIYGNGNLRYCSYRLFDDIQMMKMYKLDKETVYAIDDRIEIGRSILEHLPDQLWHGSKEGNVQEMQFGDICWVSAVNLREYSLKKAAFLRPNLYREYRECIIQEEQVWKLFKDICKVLSAAGVELRLDRCDIACECRLTVTW